jgi:hypothetical protein
MPAAGAGGMTGTTPRAATPSATPQIARKAPSDADRSPEITEEHTEEKPQGLHVT